LLFASFRLPALGFLKSTETGGFSLKDIQSKGTGIPLLSILIKDGDFNFPSGTSSNK
jgi:hypothetical protein